jgi:hypothetical protein
MSAWVFLFLLAKKVIKKRLDSLTNPVDSTSKL